MTKTFENSGSEKEFLDIYRREEMDKYVKPSVTVDSVIFRYYEGRVQTLLIKRKNHPFMGKYVHVRIGQLQGVHGLAELGIDIPAVGGIDLVLELAHLGHEGVHVAIRVAHLLADLIEAIDLGDHVAKRHAHVLDNGLVVVERRLLLQDAHGVAGSEPGIAVGDLLDTGHDLEQGRLTHAVGTHDADLGTGVEAQGHVVKNHLVAMGLTSLIHLVDKLRHLPVLSFLPAASLFLFSF